MVAVLDLLVALFLFLTRGMVPGLYDPVATLHAGGSARVTAESLLIRETPGETGNPIGQLADGTRLTLTGAGQTADGTAWWPVAAAPEARRSPATPPPTGCSRNATCRSTGCAPGCPGASSIGFASTSRQPSPASETIMHIERVRIQGFRSLYDVTFAPRPLSVLVGPNNGGKSNLVDAFAFLR